MIDKLTYYLILESIKYEIYGLIDFNPNSLTFKKSFGESLLMDEIDLG